MLKRKAQPKQQTAQKSVLRDLGAATSETKRWGPPERVDGLAFATKGPYFG